MKTLIVFTVFLALSVAKATQTPALAMACASNRYVTVADFETRVFKVAASLDGKLLINDQIKSLKVTPPKFETFPAQKHMTIELEQFGKVNLLVFDQMLMDSKGESYERSNSAHYNGSLSGNENMPLGECEILY